MTHALIAEETHTSAPPSAGARRPEQADPELPEWQRPDPGPDQLRADVLGAIGLYLISVLSLALSTATGVFGSKTASLGLSVVVLAFVTLPLAVRRRWPTPVLAVVTAAFVAIGEIPVAESTIANVALFCALYTVGAWEKDRRRAVVARAAVVTLMVVWLVSSLFRISLSDLDDEFPGEGLGALTPAVAFFLMQVLLNILYFAGAWWFGSHSWNAARERALVEYRTAQLQAEQEVVALQAVTIERLRIARELHDAVAHHVSLMGVQAAAARAVIPRDTEAATRQLLALEDSARSAVGELYDLLGTLRDDSTEGSRPASAPSTSLDIGQLPHLVEEAASAGLDVDLAVVGVARPLPPLVGLNLYRLAQEALTNVVKHAGTGTRTRVRLRYLDDRVELEITDDGRGRPMPRSRHGGLGLTGMKERAAAMRGTIVAERRGSGRSGGFLVRVTVPDAHTTRTELP